MALSKLERETIITYNEAEAEAEIYTYHRPLQRKLEKLAQERPEEVKILCADKTGSKTSPTRKTTTPIGRRRCCSLLGREANW